MMIKEKVKVLEIKPITLRKANEVIEKLHRHHKKARGCRFCLAVYENGRLCGVAIAGRPVARKCDFETVLEITRCATDGTKNAITKLYGAIVRAARPMGYKIVQTYILPDEGGASLRACGFQFDGKSKGGSWTRKDRARREDQPKGEKWKWIKLLS